MLPTSSTGTEVAPRRPTAARAALVAALLALASERAAATQRFGPLQLSGNLQSQNLVRHADASHLQFVQNRNTAHVRLDYEWLQGGKFSGKYDIHFVETSSLFLLWRGVYDSIYDTTPGFIQKEDIHGRAYGGGRQNLFQWTRSQGLPRSVLTIGGLSRGERDALTFDD